MKDGVYSNMAQYKSKSLTILVLAIGSVIEDNLFCYTLSLIAPLIPITRPLILLLLGIICLWVDKISQITATKIISTILLSSIYIWFRNRIEETGQTSSKQKMQNKQTYLIFLYLIGFSVITLGQDSYFQDFTLVIFFVLLLVFELGRVSVLGVGILVINVGLGFWSLASFACNNIDERFQQFVIGQYCTYFYQKNWYFYLSTSIICWIGTVLSHTQSQQMPAPEGNPHEIQMEEIKSKHSNDEENQPSDQMIFTKSRNEKNLQQLDLEEKLNPNDDAQQGDHDNFSPQSQLTNIFLLLPFTLFHLKQLQIPIYIYLFVLQYNKSSLYFFYLMFLSICIITFLTHPSTPLQLLLRLCLIFIVNKNFQLAITLTNAVRTVWLRSSFVIVLVILFWFSLLTVNMFHIGFVVIVLLFITKDGRDEEHQHSFRNRNWIYLMIFFDVFLVLRLMFSIAKEYELGLADLFEEILALLGISYRYGVNQSHFNLIPLIISGIITVQYWTYTSRIYNIQKSHPKSNQQPTYKIWVNKIMKIMKICYYKMIPWLSHFLVLSIVLQLEFSFITVVVSLWSIALLWTHMIKKNNLEAYRVLYFRWMKLLQLLSVEIILRYIFQLLKFPFIYGYIGKLPFIEYLVKYQQILGLVIRESSTGYFKNFFTKFQIMIGLDFIFIAVSFLAIEYYNILIKYQQLQQQNPNQPTQQQSHIQQIYNNYINFKLTEWLISYNDLMLSFSKIFIKLYYFMLATYACLYYSYASFFYFGCAILYYFFINRWYYMEDVLEGKQKAVGRLFQFWREYHGVGEEEDIGKYGEQGEEDEKRIGKEHGDQLQQAYQPQQNHQQQEQPLEPSDNPSSQKPHPSLLSLKQPKSELQALHKKIQQTNTREFQQTILQYHAKLRPIILFMSMMFVMMTYASKFLHTSEIRDFLGDQQIQYYRFLLYVFGTSYQTRITLVTYMVIIAMTVLEIKCCGLLSKNVGRDFVQLVADSDEDPSVIPMPTNFKKLHNRKYTVQFPSSQSIKPPQLQRQFQQRPNSTQQHYKFSPQSKVSAFLDEAEDEIKQERQKQQKSTDKKFIDMDISLRLGVNKMLERLFVILLVFVSILENQNPFSIIYLCLAWFLNYMGNQSILGLSYTLSALVLCEYTLIITDYPNPYLNLIDIYPQYATDNHSWLIRLLSITDNEWITYLSFGYTLSQFIVLYLSVLILVSYQFVFWIQQYNWLHILQRIYKNIERIQGVKHKLYNHIIGIYEYALVYSPICITILCLGLYFIDFTATNMFLGVLSILFVYKSFLFENYTSSRKFWKSYFRILQLMIIIFMVIYCILNTPMYSQYCNPILCSQQQFRTKVTKTILLLILQIGIDLISSHHFIASMQKLRGALDSTSSYYKLAISYVQNDRKILREFKSINKKRSIKNNIEEVNRFLEQIKADPTAKFNNKKQDVGLSQFWLDTFLELLPSLIDSQLIMTPTEARHMILEDNSKYIAWLENQSQEKITEEKLVTINQSYVRHFQNVDESPNSSYLEPTSKKTKLEEELALKKKINDIIKFCEQNEGSRPTRSLIMTPQKSEHKEEQIIQQIEEPDHSAEYRKSYIQQIMPFDPNQICYSLLRRSLHKFPNNKIEGLQQSYPDKDLNRQTLRKLQNQRLSAVNVEEKKKILYLLIFESVLSNWHYLTYFLMVLLFIYNMGIFTSIFPLLAFAYGMISTYQASKNVWRIAFLALILPIFIKYSISIGLISISNQLVFLLIGSNPTSILLQYLLICFIIVQCSILKVVGLYDQTAPQVQCMKMALIRNIINVKNKNIIQQRQSMFELLNKCCQSSTNTVQYIFSKRECKRGYDYSTMMVSIQITILIYIFCFYEKMAIREQLTFYKMIEYNQFSTGMVILAFIQLGFILLERIFNVIEFNDDYTWDITLICKYVLLLVSMVLVHFLVLVFFPLNSNSFEFNTYVVVFYVIYSFYFLISALQIKYGVDKQSRGFMDRYTWYNGFIYMFYRAIPFLFEFKIFSDWTFTNTSLRLFDWIKFQEVLGFLYVAKCNSLFLRGKQLGSKIQWWKKLLMGFPLLFAIILLLFGPLVLFSSLNPLASLNEVSGGYFQLALRINKTNEYPLYINTHITDIKFLNQTDINSDSQIKQIIKNYEIDVKSIQQIHLQLYSDQYWQISQGSYQKLIDESQDSLYELSMRVKFQRNFTGATPVYLLNTYKIKQQEVPLFKKTLKGEGAFLIENFFPEFIRIDNNNGIHYLSGDLDDGSGKIPIKFHAEMGKTTKKKYWVIDDGLTFKISSDKYSKAIFGYSVMSFYISIILVVANYFRFLFQGSAYNIILSDIPYPDPILSICDGVYQARARNDIYQQQILYWTLIDIMRSPDTIKALAGDYLDARLETVPEKKDK